VQKQIEQYKEFKDKLLSIYYALLPMQRLITEDSFRPQFGSLRILEPAHPKVFPNYINQFFNLLFLDHFISGSTD
jgi:hypothetical protein